MWYELLKRPNCCFSLMSGGKEHISFAQLTGLRANTDVPVNCFGSSISYYYSVVFDLWSCHCESSPSEGLDVAEPGASCHPQAS